MNAHQEKDTGVVTSVGLTSGECIVDQWAETPNELGTPEELELLLAQWQNFCHLVTT